jgi:hypothetical protein
MVTGQVSPATSSRSEALTIEPRCALRVAIALRQSLIEIAIVRAASAGQQTKMELVYQYRHRVYCRNVWRSTRHCGQGAAGN